jgi:hypothetical protein
MAQRTGIRQQDLIHALAAFTRAAKSVGIIPAAAEVAINKNSGVFCVFTLNERGVRTKVDGIDVSECGSIPTVYARLTAATFALDAAQRAKRCSCTFA